MSESPGLLVAAQVVEMPDGNAAEVVLDVDGDVFARWRSSGQLREPARWSPWRPVSSGAIAVFLAPAGQRTRSTGKATGYVTVTSGASRAGRTVYSLTADDIGVTGL
jgi:hypothetical protein